MRVLVDTNVLLRGVEPKHPFFLHSKQAVARLFRQNDEVFYCPQNITESWSVATRPLAVNGLGLAQEVVLKEIASIESSLTLLPDAPAIYEAWKAVVTEYQVVGAQVHDARLAAVMTVYGIESILTFNAADFQRYSPIKAILPAYLIV